MSNANGALEFTIRARNEATGALDDFDKRMRSTEASTNRVGRAMASSLADIIPGVDQAVHSISRFTEAAGRMGSFSQGAAVAIGAGAAALTSYTVALDRAVQKQVDFVMTLRSFDAGRVLPRLCLCGGSIRAWGAIDRCLRCGRSVR